MPGTEANVKRHRLFSLLIPEVENVGMSLSPDRYIRLQRLWRMLPDGCPIPELRNLLCPLFATDERQQETFHITFDRIVRDLDTVISEMPSKSQQEPQKDKITEKSTGYTSSQETNPPLSNPASKSDIPKSATERRPLVVDLGQCTDPPYSWNIAPKDNLADIHIGEGFNRTMLQLRRREWADHTAVDVPASIRATIGNGRLPVLRYKRQTRPPEYLLLVERFSRNDHRAAVFDYVFQALRANDVFAERFFYDGDPRRNRNEQYPAGQSLYELRNRYPDARLVVLGSGYRLLHPRTGMLADWAIPMLAWPVRALLTPVSHGEWGYQERQLQTDFLVLPASVESLQYISETPNTSDLQYELLPDYIRDIAETEPLQLQQPIMRSLRQHFDSAMLCWIAACAVYPALHFELTRQLGWVLSESFGYNLLTSQNLLELSRLTWFTTGRIPVPVRRDLMKYLQQRHPERNIVVVKYLRDLMQQNQPSEDNRNSMAYAEHRVNLAVLKAMSGQINPEIAAELRAVVTRLKEEESWGDFVLLGEEWEKLLGSEELQKDDEYLPPLSEKHREYLMALLSKNLLLELYSELIEDQSINKKEIIDIKKQIDSIDDEWLTKKYDYSEYLDKREIFLKRLLQIILDIDKSRYTPNTPSLKISTILTPAQRSLPLTFTGRENEIKSIRELLTSSKNDIVLLNGEGGIGKTTFAAAYWQRFQNEYRHMAWLFCENGILDAIRSQLPEPLGLVETLNPYANSTDEQIQVIKTAMTNLPKDCLLVLDNANDPSHIHDFLQIMSDLGWHVLITSRCSGVLPDPQAEYRLTSLQPEEARKLFKANYDEPQNPNFIALLDRFLDVLGYNTLCIELFSKNLHAGEAWGQNLEQLLQNLEQNGLRLGESSFDALIDWPQRTLRTSDQIREILYNLRDLAPEESDLLTQFCLLPVENHQLAVLAALLVGENPGGLKRRLEGLVRKGWLASDTATYWITPTAQKTMLTRQKDRLWELAKPMVAQLNKTFEIENTQPKNHETTKALAELAFGLMENLETANEDLAILFDRLWIYFRANDNLIKAIEAAKCMHLTCETYGDKNNLAVSYSRLGETHLALGNLESALTFFEKYNQLEKELYATYPESVAFKNGLAISYSKLGETHSDLGNLDQALTFFEDRTQLFKELYDSYPHNVNFKNSLALSYSNLGETYSSLKNSSYAINSFEHALALFRELSESYPHDNFFKKQLATLKNKRNDKVHSIPETKGKSGQKTKVFLCYAWEDQALLDDFYVRFHSYNSGDMEILYDLNTNTGNMHRNFQDFAGQCDVAILLMNGRFVNPESYPNKHELLILKERQKKGEVIIIGVRLSNVSDLEKWNAEESIYFFQLTNNDLPNTHKKNSKNSIFLKDFAVYENIHKRDLNIFHDRLGKWIKKLVESNKLRHFTLRLNEFGKKYASVILTSISTEVILELQALCTEIVLYIRENTPDIEEQNISAFYRIYDMVNALVAKINSRKNTTTLYFTELGSLLKDSQHISL